MSAALTNLFFDHPILNCSYKPPARHWERDSQGKPTQQIIESRRAAEYITPIPKPRKRKATPEQERMIFDEGMGISTKKQEYDPTPVINELRYHLEQWRNLPNPNHWQVTPETACLLEHWRHYPFNNIQPFIFQVETVETAIWFTEVAPKLGKI